MNEYNCFLSCDTLFACIFLYNLNNGSWEIGGQFIKLSVVRGIRGQFWNWADNLKKNDISKFDGQFLNLTDNFKIWRTMSIENLNYTYKNILIFLNLIIKLFDV